MAPAHCGLLKGFKKCCWENEPDVPFRKMWSRAKWQEQMGKLRFLRGLGAHAECKVCSLGFLRNQISVRWVLCRGTSSGGKAGGSKAGMCCSSAPSSTPGIPDQWNVSFCLLVLLDLWNVFNWFSVPSYASSQLKIVCGAWLPKSDHKVAWVCATYGCIWPPA